MEGRREEWREGWREGEKEEGCKGGRNRSEEGAEEGPGGRDGEKGEELWDKAVKWPIGERETAAFAVLGLAHRGAHRL